MKRILLWLAGVALGVALLLAAATGASFAFTTQGHLPAAAAQFGGTELTPNGWRWRAPLIGGRMDRIFSAPPTLAVQKLGVLYNAHPALTLPDWVSESHLTIENDAGQQVFAGPAAQYDGFLYPANGGYKAQLTLWRLAPGQDKAQFDPEAQGSLRPNPGLERPARPTGWYQYIFRFSVQASPVLELSAERVDQGGVIGLQLTGMAGDTAPTVETDLGRVDCVRCPGGWRGYIPAAYNAPAGAHTVRVTAGGEMMERTITVIPRDFGSAEYPSGAGDTGQRSGAVPQSGMAAVRAARPGQTVAGRLCLPRPGLYGAGGFWPGQADKRHTRCKVQLHTAVYHPRRGRPCPGSGGRRAGQGAAAHRQYGRHRPRLRPAQLSLRPGCHPCDPGADP